MALLPLGFGDQMHTLSSQTKAKTVDGNHLLEDYLN
jgi:hypothetical protein